MKEETTYYLIRDRIVGKCEYSVYYLFKDGKWEPDDECVIMDHLWGYDSSEPADSPYAMGSMDIMDELEVITYEEAMELTGGKE